MELKHFHAAIRRDPSVLDNLPLVSWWRYSKGKFPKALRWLMEHPELLRALADDIEQAQKHQVVRSESRAE